MFKKLLPKEHRFFELFEQQTAVIKKGLDLFELLLREYSRRKELTKQIKDMENDADAMAWAAFPCQPPTRLPAASSALGPFAGYPPSSGVLPETLSWPKS